MLKNSSVILCLIVLLISCEDKGTIEPNEVNIAGTWTGWHHSETTNQTNDVTYVFTQNDSKLSGRYTNNTTGKPYDIDGTIEGSKVNIILTDGSYTWTGNGTVSGDKITGTFTSTSGQRGSFEITRQ